MEGERGVGVFLGSKCPIFIVCLLHDLPTCRVVYVGRLFFLYASAGFLNFLKSSNCKNETKSSKLRLGENGERVDLAHVGLAKTKTVSHEKVLSIPIDGSCRERGVVGV